MAPYLQLSLSFYGKVWLCQLSLQDGLDIAIPEGQAKILRDRGYLGKEFIFGIRPEDILDTNIAIEAYPEDTVTGEIVVSQLLGSETMLYLKLGETEYVARVSTRDTFEAGDKVALTFNITKGHFFDLATEQAIR